MATIFLVIYVYIRINNSSVYVLVLVFALCRVSAETLAWSVAWSSTLMPFSEIIAHVLCEMGK